MYRIPFIFVEDPLHEGPSRLSAVRPYVPPKQPCLDAEIHRKIATCILGCFPVDSFECNGTYSSLWLSRLELTANNTQQLINELAVASGFSTNTL